MSHQYQVIVIGSGSAGQQACLAAAKAELHTLLIEQRDYLGGTSFYTGAYAVRALRACAGYLKQTEQAPKFGSSLDLVEYSWGDWLSAQRQSSSRLSVEFSRAVDLKKVDVRFGRAKLSGPNEITLTDPEGVSQAVTASYIILATGSRPNFPIPATTTTKPRGSLSSRSAGRTVPSVRIAVLSTQ